MPKLPRGIFRRKDRPGFWTRDRRNRGDRWISLGSDIAVARVRATEIRGGRPTLGPLTVKDAAQKWLAGPVRARRNEAGQKLAGQRVKRHLLPVLGHAPLSQVSAEQLRAYRFALEESGLSPQSVAHILSDVRALLWWSLDEGYLSHNPVPRRLLPRVDDRVPDRLTDEEAKALVEIREPYGFYLRLLLSTGLRWREAARAEAQHVERGHLVVARTKTGKVRRVPLSPSMLAEIRGRVGKLVHLVNAQSLALAARKLSGVGRFHVHMTRHTFACRWLEAGSSIETLSAVLGHLSIKTTQRYGRPNEDAVRRDARRVWGESVA